MSDLTSRSNSVLQLFLPQYWRPLVSSAFLSRYSQYSVGNVTQRLSFPSATANILNPFSLAGSDKWYTLRLDLMSSVTLFNVQSLLLPLNHGAKSRL